MAVCEGDGGYYLFMCDAEWNVMFDTWCQTLEDATEDGGYEWLYPNQHDPRGGGMGGRDDMM